MPRSACVVGLAKTGVIPRKQFYTKLFLFNTVILVARIIKDEFTFVTNNRVDFLQLFRKMDLHPGLIILVPNVVPDLQRALLGRCAPLLVRNGSGKHRD
jgi:hypothetical protein